MEKLKKRIEEAIRRQNADGIEGWAISCPEELKEAFEECIIGEQGCNSRTCRCVSHDPSAPIVKLVPVRDTILTKLGSESSIDGDWYQYFHVARDDHEWFLELYISQAWHSRLRIVENVSDCVLGVLVRSAS